MSIFTERLSDEGLLTFVWIALIFLAVIFASAVYQVHTRVREAETNVYSRIQKVEDAAEQAEDKAEENKTIIIEALNQSRETEVKVERMSTEILHLEKLVERMEKSSRSMSNGVESMSRASQDIGKMLDIFGAMTPKLQDEDNTPGDAKAAHSEPNEEPVPAQEAEEVKEEKGKRIWWTLGLVRRKTKEK